MSRGSWWSFTINNPSPDDRAALKAPIEPAVELFYQDEIGEGGTLHIQGCVHTTYMRMVQLKEWLPRAHLEVARNKDALKNYVKKKETGLPGTQVEWRRNPTADIVDIEPRLGFLDVMRMLAAYALVVPGDSAETIYQRAVRDVYSDRPEYLDQITAARILPAFKIVWENLLSESAEIHSNHLEPSDDADSRQWLGWECPVCNLEQCECKD